MSLKIKNAGEVVSAPETCTIRVKVVQIKKVASSLGNERLDYRLITFNDEEGSELKSVVYTKDVARFGNAIEEQMAYEITNPKVKAIGIQHRGNSHNKVYHLSFSNKTVIRPIFGRDFAAKPRYVLIVSIPKAISLYDHYDVLGIVLYVETNCHISRLSGKLSNVCELAIVDQSSEQVLVVTAWEKRAVEKIMSLQPIAAPFPVVGFVGLRTSFIKGFSLMTTSSTVVDLHPLTNEASALRAWEEGNRSTLAAKSLRVFKSRCPDTHSNVITIAELLQKNESNTLQEERFEISVQLEEFDCEQLRLYLGCDNCNAINHIPIGISYACTTCGKRRVVSTPRISVQFKARDETGSHSFTAMDHIAEALLEIDVADLYSMSKQERDYYLPQIERHIQSTTYCIRIVPASFLARYQTLVWEILDISEVWAMAWQLCDVA